MNWVNYFSTFPGTLIIDIFTSIIISLIVSVIANALYKYLNSNKIKTELQYSIKPQLYHKVIVKKDDFKKLDRIHKNNCCFYSVRIHTGEKGNYLYPETINIDEVNVVSDLSLINIHNGSEKMVEIKLMIDRASHPISLDEISERFLDKEESVTIIFDRYECPNIILVDFDGVDLEYQLSNKEGFVKAKVKSI